MQRITFLPLVSLFISASAFALPAHPWATKGCEIPHHAGAPEIAPSPDDEVPSLPTPQQMRREAPSYPTPQQMRREAPSYPTPQQMRREAPSYPAPQQMRREAPSYPAPQQMRREAPSYPAPRLAPRVAPLQLRRTPAPEAHLGRKATRSARTHVVVLTPQEARVWHLLNTSRRARGLTPLRVDPLATRVARAHSADMCRRRYFSHGDPEGGRPWTRLRNAGVRFSAAAENIAKGYATAVATHQGWMQSAGHRHNRLNPRYHRMGVGVFRCGQTLYWTELFLR